jgi:hypothetical protein
MKINSASLICVLLITAYLQAQAPQTSVHSIHETRTSRTTRVYSSPDCGIRFQIPSDWVLGEDVLSRSKTGTGSKHVCAIHLEPPNLKELLADFNVDLYSVDVDVLIDKYESVLGDRGFERKKDGSWVVLGRLGIESPSEKTFNSTWKGIKGERSVGCSYEGEDHGYAGMCEMYSAVLSDGKSRVVTIEANAQSRTVFDMILRTLDFVPARPEPNGGGLR